MALYRLYHLRDDRIVRREDLDADGDVAATAIARAKAGDGAVELWKGNRKLAAFGDAPGQPDPD